MKIGTVGTNFVVVSFVEAARKVPGVSVDAAYSRKQETADAFADKAGIARRFTDKEAFLHDPDFDFVYVASPNSLHYQWVKDALNAGKNVICEKPFTSTSKELAELIALSKEKNLFLFEAITIPHLPNYKLLKSKVAEVGELKFVQFNFSQYSSRYDAYLRGENPNVFNPEFSGGALMDLNYYNLNFAVGLFGVPEDIKYIPNLVDNGIDTSGLLVLKYKGFVVSGVACKDSKSELMNQIQGVKGYITIPGASSLCSEFTIHTKEGCTTYNEQDPDAYTYEIGEFQNIFAANDRKKCDEKLAYNFEISKLIEKARREAGIHFPADDK